MDNEILARWQGWETTKDDRQTISIPLDYHNDDAAAMSLLDTLAEKGHEPKLQYYQNIKQWGMMPDAGCGYEWLGDTRREAAVATCLGVVRNEILPPYQEVFEAGAAAIRDKAVELCYQELAEAHQLGIDKGRKQAAREIMMHLLGMFWTIPYKENEPMIYRDQAIEWLRDKFGLEGGEGWTGLAFSSEQALQ